MDYTQASLAGVVPDLIDKQYQQFSKYNYKLTSGGNISDNVDLRGYSSPRHQQLNTNCCVAASTIKALEIKRIIKYGIAKHVDLSILHLYWNCRDQMGHGYTSFNTGTQISIACDTLRRFGVCSDKLFPFDQSKIYTPPPVMALREAQLNTIKSSLRIVTSGEDRLNDILTNLHAGNPVVFATAVGASWFKYGNSSQPLGIETQPKGNHAMVIVGYINGLFVVENSWGDGWGQDGFCFVKPEVFTTNSSFDFWAMIDGSEAWHE